MAGRQTEPIHPTPSVWTDLMLEDDELVPLPGGKGAMRFRPIPAGEFWMGSRGEYPRLCLKTVWRPDGTFCSRSPATEADCHETTRSHGRTVGSD
jgi:hypothetical protein